jgi:hypothetical protein
MQGSPHKQVRDLLKAEPLKQDWVETFGTIDKQAQDARVPDVTSGDGCLRTDLEMRELTAKIGCDIVAATDSQLFVDIDTEDQFEMFKKQVQMFEKHFAMRGLEVRPSKQGLPHRHVVVELAGPMPLVTRIALQACLGSDAARELISMKRALAGEKENVVVFFERKAGWVAVPPPAQINWLDDHDSSF